MLAIEDNEWSEAKCSYCVILWSRNSTRSKVLEVTSHPVPLGWSHSGIRSNREGPIGVVLKSFSQGCVRLSWLFDWNDMLPSLVGVFCSLSSPGLGSLPSQKNRLSQDEIKSECELYDSVRTWVVGLQRAGGGWRLCPQSPRPLRWTLVSGIMGCAKWWVVW